MTADEIVDVRLIGIPLREYGRMTEHHDGLMRELALISSGPGSAPGRLLDLATDARARFGPFSVGPRAALADAIERHDESADIVYRLPRAAREAAVLLGERLDEADEYCRREQLLTLETPPAVKRLRTWFLRQFVDQIDGSPPVAWPDWPA